MKSILKIGSIFFISTISVLGYGEDRLFERNDFRVSKSYNTDLVLAQAYYDAALRGEFLSEECNRDVFLLSSLELIGRKKDGWTKGGIYKDIKGDVWFVKKGQSPINEYLGSKVMNLLVGPVVPEVALLIDAPEYTASKLLPGFVSNNDAKEEGKDKPTVWQTIETRVANIKLEVAMDLIALADRNMGNMGHIEREGQFEFARVDFDASFRFDLVRDADDYYEDRRRTTNLAMEEIYGVPDALILHVLGEAYETLWNSGIPVDYESYKDLGNILIARKRGLGGVENLLIENLRRYSSNTDAIKLLVESGADVTIRDIEDNSTPLHKQAEFGKPYVLKLLLDKGADINARNYKQETPLHHAVLNGNIKGVGFLIDNGADIHAKDASGKTALEMAIKDEIIEILREKGAK